MLSDGENTGGPDPIAVAQLAAGAGVHISTIGFGTRRGRGDRHRRATRWPRPSTRRPLTDIADTTGGTLLARRPTTTASELDQISRSIDLRIATTYEHTEITAAFAGAAIVLLLAGGLLMTRWYGRPCERGALMSFTWPLALLSLLAAPLLLGAAGGSCAAGGAS